MEDTSYKLNPGVEGPVREFDQRLTAIRSGAIDTIAETVVKKATEVGGVNVKETLDLGWTEKAKDVETLVQGGVSNADIWLLLRRFDNQMSSLRSSTIIRNDELDLQLSDDAEFSALKLRSQVERLYMGAILGGAAALRHVARLRSWREPIRTGLFCVTYFAAWYSNVLLALLAFTLMIMILVPQSRVSMFPPMPLSLVDWKTGAATKPSAGVLGSIDSLSGAPENALGEAVEREASNFVAGLAGISMNIMTAEDPRAEPKNQQSEKQAGDSAPEPDKATMLVAAAKDKANGTQTSEDDKTKKAMTIGMWSGMMPGLRILYAVSNIWERIANALNPMEPFPILHNRLQLTIFISPLFLVAWLPAAIIVKLVTFGIGVEFFAEPLLRKVSFWPTVVSVADLILKGVPTNAQIMITLLRAGETCHSPLVPVPLVEESPPEDEIPVSSDAWNTNTMDQPLGVSQDHLAFLAAPNTHDLDDSGGPSSEIAEAGGKKTSRGLGMVKSGLRAAVHVAFRVDKLRAKAGRESAKNRLDVLPSKGNALIKEGPSKFSVRSAGKSTELMIGADGVLSLEGHWKVHVNQITELRKISGLGMKSRLAVGWALELDQNDGHVKDGIELRDRSGEAYILTAVAHRDQLFDRLCAMGQQNWEVL